jgi:hypothetical protein
MAFLAKCTCDDSGACQCNHLVDGTPIEGKPINSGIAALDNLQAKVDELLAKLQANRARLERIPTVKATIADNKSLNQKGTTEMNTLEKMSAAERAKFAESFEANAAHMTQQELTDAISVLNHALATSPSLKAKAEADRRVKLASAVQATRNGPYTKQTVVMIDNALARAGLPNLDELALKPAAEIHALLANEDKKIAKRTSNMTREQFDKTKFMLLQLGAFA